MDRNYSNQTAAAEGEVREDDAREKLMVNKETTEDRTGKQEDDNEEESSTQSGEGEKKRDMGCCGICVSYY